MDIKTEMQVGRTIILKDEGVACKNKTSLRKRLSPMLLQAALGLGMIAATGSAHAIIIFDSWLTNEGGSPNYQVSVANSTTIANAVDVEVTIDPWNAEALMVAFDLGALDVGAWSIGGVSTGPTSGGTVAMGTYQQTGGGPPTTVSMTDCNPAATGQAGNCAGLNGLTVPLLNPDSDWEYVFQLGNPGYEGYQTFRWTLTSTLTSTTNNMTVAVALNENLFSIAGARGQVYCENGGTLPDDQPTCGGSDKSYSATPTTPVPEPATLALLGIGFAGLGMARLRRTRRS